MQQSGSIIKTTVGKLNLPLYKAGNQSTSCNGREIFSLTLYSIVPIGHTGFTFRTIDLTFILVGAGKGIKQHGM